MVNEFEEKNKTQVDDMKNMAEETAGETRDAESITEAESVAMDTEIKQRELVQARLAPRNWNVSGKSDPLVGPGTASMTPGSMQMSATVKLHSRLSINLFRGRKGEPEKNIRPIIGLARFARQVSMVWSASSLDDPFADQTLIDIEHAYEQAVKTVKEKTESMQRLLDGMEDFEITLQASEQPVSVDLKFFSPWGFRGATLIKEFDKLVRMALTARHLGIFAEDEWRTVVHASQRAIRHMFTEVDNWVATGVKRADMRAETKIGKRAIQRYADLRNGYLMLDEDVMSGKYRAQLSPVNRILEAYQAEAMKENVKLKNKNESAKSVEAAVDAENNSHEAEKVEPVRRLSGAAGKPNFGFLNESKSGDKSKNLNAVVEVTDGEE